MRLPFSQRAKLRDDVLQAVVLTLVVATIWAMVHNAQVNLEKLGLTNGFGFLERSTGWSYSFALIERSIDDSYARTLTIGLMNTLFLGILAIITTTVVGFVFGTLYASRNVAVQAFAAIYINIFRNLPLILQLVFWYAVFIHLPAPRQAVPVADMMFLSNRGVQIPALNIDVGVGLAATLISIAAFVLILRHVTADLLVRIAAGLAAVVGVFLIAALVAGNGEAGLLSVPELKGLRFVGGIGVSVEFVAMIVAITLYGAAYIAEVVRGGLREVPKGLVEAGQALGLSEARIWWKIKMPLALRTIIPPLGNQWIFMMKATTIGVAIGFSDLFMLISTSITQSGQTLELIFLLIAAFILINFTLAQVVNMMNARLALKGH